MPTVTNNRTLHHPSSLLNLTGAMHKVNSVTFVEHQNDVLLTVSEDMKVLVYDLNTDGRPKAVFSGHDHWIEGLAVLDDDLVPSISGDKLLTWHMRNRKFNLQLHLSFLPQQLSEHVGQWTHDKHLSTVAKLDHFRIVLRHTRGGVTILKHSSGTSFLPEKIFTKAHSYRFIGTESFISIVPN